LSHRDRQLDDDVDDSEHRIVIHPLTQKDKLVQLPLVMSRRHINPTQCHVISFFNCEKTWQSRNVHLHNSCGNRTITHNDNVPASANDSERK